MCCIIKKHKTVNLIEIFFFHTPGLALSTIQGVCEGGCSICQGQFLSKWFFSWIGFIMLHGLIWWSIFYKYIYNWQEPCENVVSCIAKFIFLNQLAKHAYIYSYTSQPGPGAAREKLDELTSPIWTFYVTQGFLSRDPFGVAGVRGSGWWDHACVKNLPWVGGDWSGGSGVKRVHRYKQSLLYI